MKKKIRIAVMGFLLIAIVSGCGGSNKSDTTTIEEQNHVEETTPQKTKKNTNKVPDEDQMRLDIVDNRINVFYLNDQEETLEISSLTLERRKTDEDEGLDEAYVSIVFENEMYTVIADCVLSYSLYDVGGWCLDYCEFTSYSSTAKAPFYSEEEFLSLLCEYFSDGYIQNREHGFNVEGNYCDSIQFAGFVEYPYMTAMITGTSFMVFCDDMWHQEIVFEQMDTDWTPLLGSWQYRNQHLNMGAGFYSLDISLDVSNIVQLSRDEVEVSYSGKTYLYDKDGYIDVDEEIGPKTRTMKISYQTETILGQTIEIPVGFSGAPLPWRYDSSVFVEFNRDAGVYSRAIEASYSTEYFSKIISTAEVQSAIDALKEMNG